MIKIIDKLDNKEMIVTQGAYENLYKALGYRIVGEKKEAAIKEVAAPEEPAVEPEEIVPEKNDEDDKLMDNILNKKYNRKKN